MCILFIPEITLFVFLNFVIFDRGYHVCQGSYLDPQVLAKDRIFLPKEEGKYLFIVFFAECSLMAYFILTIFLHICYTCCFRV